MQIQKKAIKMCLLHVGEYVEQKARGDHLTCKAGTSAFSQLGLGQFMAALKHLWYGLVLHSHRRQIPDKATVSCLAVLLLVYLRPFCETSFYPLQPDGREDGIFRREAGQPAHMHI